MSIDTDIRAAGGERSIVTQAGSPAKPDATSSTFGARTAFVMAVGGLLTGSLVLAALSAGTRGGADYELQPVAKSEIAAASQSLLPAQAAMLTEQAEACRAPLASLMVRATGSFNGSVRIRSGAYVSPNVRLGPQPDRIALPYPAPYVTGHGQIAVESNADGMDVFLSPGIHIGASQSPTLINVRWNPDAPC